MATLIRRGTRIAGTPLASQTPDWRDVAAFKTASEPTPAPLATRTMNTAASVQAPTNTESTRTASVMTTSSSGPSETFATNVSSVPQAAPTSTADQDDSLISYDGPFANYKFDMLGNVITRTKEEKAMGYKDYWPKGYEAYVSGDLTGSGLFTYALHNLPGDTIGSSFEELQQRYKPGRLPYVSVRFGKTGGSYSWTGGGFGY